MEAKKNGAFLGAGGFNNWEHTHKKAEIGFWLLPEHWGKGIMKEGMNCICNYGFNSLKLHRIEGFVESENQKCISAIEKLNFSYEGTMKDCEIKEGRFISISVYSKINPLD
ncbi:GNAT family N-acetyltransferase [Wenyingzhuangia sp. IMCC45574]